eukprot:9557406-Heterocapsa_arctica.AAC.1
MDKSKFTEEDMNNIRQPDERATASDGQDPPETREHREHQEREQGDDTYRNEADRQDHPRRDSTYQGQDQTTQGDDE